MSRTPYSPFVLKATAPEPWNAGRGVGTVGVAAAVVSSWVSGGSSRVWFRGPVAALGVVPNPE